MIVEVKTRLKCEEKKSRIMLINKVMLKNTIAIISFVS